MIKLKIPEEWIEEIEKEPDKYYEDPVFLAKVKLFVKKYWQTKSRAAMCKITGAKPHVIQKFVAEFKDEHRKKLENIE